MHCIKFTVQQQQQRLLMHNSLNAFPCPQFPSLLSVAFHLPAYSILLFSKLLHALWHEIHGIATEYMNDHRGWEFLGILRENENYFWTYWKAATSCLKSFLYPSSREYINFGQQLPRHTRRQLRPHKIYVCWMIYQQRSPTSHVCPSVCLWQRKLVSHF